MPGKHKPGTQRHRFTTARKEIYLAELRRTGLRKPAALAAGISLSTPSAHKKKYPEFAEAEERAFVAYSQAIEDEIYRRAMEGVAKPVYQRGEQVGTIREYSDRLLIHLSKRHIPEYADKVRVDQHTTHRGTVAVGLEDLSKLSDEGRDLLRKLIQCRLKDSDDDVPEEEEGSAE